MTRVLVLVTLLAAPLAARAAAQDTLDVVRLQEEAVRSDPRTGQRALLRSATDLRLEVIAADRLPEVEFNGQATHQSDVTRPTFGVPGITVPDFPKDRWQTTLDVRQRLYDGGDVARRRELEEARRAAEEATAVAAEAVAAAEEERHRVDDLDARRADLQARVEELADELARTEQEAAETAEELKRAERHRRTAERHATEAAAARDRALAALRALEEG
jgi:hypothetical protein